MKPLFFIGCPITNFRSAILLSQKNSFIACLLRWQFGQEAYGPLEKVGGRFL